MQVKKSLWCHLLLAVLFGAPATAGAQDLVSSITAIQVQGDQVTYQVQICNEGSTKASSWLALYYHLAAAPDCGTGPSSTWNVVNLNPGECRNFNTVRSNSPLGNFTAWARADYDCQVTEDDESNNNASMTYAVQAALYVVSLTASVTGTTVTYTITVRNSGASTTTPFTLGLYYDGIAAPACGSTPDQSWTIGGLANNTTVTNQYVRTNVPAGTYLAWVMVDSGCVVAEVNETDNVAAEDYSVGPDLHLSSPSVAVSGSTVTYSVYVCNLGTTNSGPFTVNLWYDLVVEPACGAAGTDHTWTVTDLAAWTGNPATSCTTLTHGHSATPAGSYTAWFFADPQCILAESDEENNLRSRPYAVLPPDYYISEYTAIVAGSQVTHSATVCNKGAGSDIPFLVALYPDLGAAPACATTPAHTWPAVGGLASGACTTLTHLQSGVATGGYTGWVMADRACTVTEADETNNTRSAPYAISPTQPDLYLGSLAAVVSGSTVTFSALVCNAGLDTATTFEVGFYDDRTTAPDCAATQDATVSQSGGLGAGLCTMVTHVRTGGTPGTFTGWVLADRTCVVGEFNESNNAAPTTYTVPPPQQSDLQIDALTASVTGSTVVYEATICNKGTADAASSTVGLYHHRSSTPSAGCLDAPDTTASVGVLVPGACAQRTWTQANTAPGSYQAWAMADSACVVAESVESNNTASQAYLVVVVVPDLGVPDGSAAGDSGPAPDGSPPGDASPPGEGGVQPDAPLPFDGGIGNDGGVGGDRGPRVDGGTTTAGDDGCGCQLSETGIRQGLGLPLLLGLWLLVSRRRRPSTGRRQ